MSYRFCAVHYLLICCYQGFSDSDLSVNLTEMVQLWDQYVDASLISDMSVRKLSAVISHLLHVGLMLVAVKSWLPLFAQLIVILQELTGLLTVPANCDPRWEIDVCVFDQW